MLAEGRGIYEQAKEFWKCVHRDQTWENILQAMIATQTS